MEPYIGLNHHHHHLNLLSLSLEPSNNKTMVGASLNSTHSLSLKPNATPSTVKFLCSYGGKILPRYPDGKLRYHGGHTRVLSAPRSVSFAELLVKMGELCGASVSLRCQLPSEDLDALISITSDEDLANLIEEYDRASSSLKIRAFLSPPKSAKKISPPPSRRSFGSPIVSPSSRPQALSTHQIAKPLLYPKHSPGKVPQYSYPVHNGNLWL